MKTDFIDGRILSQEILEEVRQSIEAAHLSPKLLIFQIGENPASRQFVSLKQRKGKEVGVEVFIEEMPGSTYDNCLPYISKRISQQKDAVDGIMIQLPLPMGVNTQEALSLIPSDLDVDGLRLLDSPYNTAVADAVLFVIRRQIDLKKESSILILGDSAYVGSSIAITLKKNQFSDIVCVNEFTENKSALLANADLVISCIGKPQLYRATQLKIGAILIDVGTSRNKEGSIVGDFDTSMAEGHLRAYTPVPGGIGPLTVAMLLKHTAQNSLLRHQAK